MRAFLLSLDAMVAVSLMLLIALFLSGLSFAYSSPEISYQRLYYSGKDILYVMDTVTVENMQDFDSIQYYQSTGVITEQDSNKTLLDVIGSLWASSNITEAANITSDVIGKLMSNSRFGYNLLINNNSIYSNNVPTGRYYSKFSTIISGLDIGEPVEGFVARVFVSRANKVGSTYVYFGGYVGEGNISKIVELPNYDQILDVYLEMDVGNNFTLFVNGKYSGLYNKTATGNLTADNWHMDSSHFSNFINNSNNTLWLNFSTNESQYIGGGYIKIMYNTSQLLTTNEDEFGSQAEKRYWFPGIEGVINLFSSFYVPGNLSNISGYLHFKTNYPIFFTVGNETILEINDTVEHMLYLNDSNFTSLYYPNMSLQTVPLRFGTEELELIGEGQGLDAVLVTDRTGSMDACDVSSAAGPCDCSSPAPCFRDRIKVALDADRAFVNAVIDQKDSMIGLIGYGERANPTCSFHELSDNNESLQTRIDNYYYNNYLQDCGYTCISCGIIGATEQLMENEIFYGLPKISAINVTPMHVGDSGPVTVNETLNLNINTDRFLKARLSFLGTNIDIEDDNYQNCVFINGHYLGRTCESNNVDSNGWHTCIYPIKKDWLIDGDNEVAITGADITDCFSTAGEQDDWDFKDVQLILWETNSQQPNTTSYAILQEYTMNSPPTITYSNVTDFLEVDLDKPSPVDFTTGLNTSGNTFFLGGNAEYLDGWDWDTVDGTGHFGYDDDADYKGAVNGELEVSLQTICGIFNGNCCSGYDCSAAYGIQVNITQEIIDQINLGGTYNISFDYEWDGNDDPFEAVDEVWVKGNWISPYSGPHAIGWEISNRIGDTTPEIGNSDDPDDDIAEFFTQNITEWVDGPGFYYLELGGKLIGSERPEWGSFKFDNIAGGITNGTVGQTGNVINITFDINTTGIKSAYIEFEAVDVDPTYYDCIFVNGHHIGRIDFQKWSGTNEWQDMIFDIPVSWLQNGKNNISFTGGTQKGCMRIETKGNDQWSFRNVNLTVRLSDEEYDYNRFKSMLVMSDGQANTKVGDCASYGSGSCTTVTGTATPSQEAIAKACEAHDSFNISIYAVAFGNNGDPATMQGIASCDDPTHYFASNDADELINIYQQIAQDMVNLTFAAQAINITGNVSLNNTLYNDSYLEFDYISTIEPSDFGDVTLTFENPKLNDSTGADTITDNITGTKEGWYFTPNKTQVVDSKITSYSSAFWTDRLYVKNESNPQWNLIYWLADYSDDYILMGDPFIVQIPTNYVGIGENNSVKLGTGLNPLNGSGGSPDSRVIYTLRIKGINLEGYSDVFPKADGCTVTVYYDYNGDNVYDGSAVVVVGDGTDIFDPINDSVDDAFMRLLNNMNFISDTNINSYGDGTAGDPYDGINQTNPIDLQITTDVEFKTSSIEGIQSLWGPAELEIRVWV